MSATLNMEKVLSHNLDSHPTTINSTILFYFVRHQVCFNNDLSFGHSSVPFNERKSLGARSLPSSIIVPGMAPSEGEDDVR